MTERGDTVLLRPMTLDDITAVAVLEQALFGVEAWSPELLVGELTADPGSRYYLVADDAGVITGYGGLLAQTGGQADVLTLAVAEDRWAQGIGSALLDGLLAEAAGAAVPRSSWRYGSTTTAPSGCTGGAGSPTSASAAATTSRRTPTRW